MLLKRLKHPTGLFDFHLTFLRNNKGLDVGIVVTVLQVLSGSIVIKISGTKLDFMSDIKIAN